MCDLSIGGSKTNFKSKDCIFTSRPLQLLHLDLFGPSRTQSLGGISYVLIIVGDFSICTWSLFLHAKNEAFSQFEELVRRIEKEKNLSFLKMGEFKNEDFVKFCKYII